MTSESAVERIPISLGIHSSFQAIIQGDAVLTYDVGEEVLRPARRKLSIPFSPTIFSQTEDVTNWAIKFEASGVIGSP